jgi:hypothetical protein
MIPIVITPATIRHEANGIISLFTSIDHSKRHLMPYLMGIRCLLFEAEALLLIRSTPNTLGNF